MVSDIITPGETPPGSHGLTDVAGCISIVTAHSFDRVELLSGLGGTAALSSGNCTFESGNS